MILRERLASLGYQPRPLPRAEVDLNAVAGALGADVRENGLGPYLCIEDMVRLEPPGRSHGAIDAGAHPMVLEHPPVDDVWLGVTVVVDVDVVADSRREPVEVRTPGRFLERTPSKRSYET